MQIVSKQAVQEVLVHLKEKVDVRDAGVMEALSSAKADANISDIRAHLSDELLHAINQVHHEVEIDGEQFHSRNPLAGLAQAHLSAPEAAVTHNDIGDVLPAVIDVFGEGNPIVWAPVMVNILLEHIKPKAAFRPATEEKSFLSIPNTCKIALLGDWGADNNHAQRIAQLVRDRGAEIAIHLGDIYYAGNEYECQRFLANWPLKVKKGNSFALNGNHEMYSRGIPYFGTVLPAFEQEASYFTLHNDYWQLHGLDTAYVPFSIDGSVPPPERPGFLKQIESHLTFGLLGGSAPQPDSRLAVQRAWLKDKLMSSGGKKNILLSHNQPTSAYLPEFEAGAPLYQQFRQLQEEVGTNAVAAWFFGHEHKGTIYKDDDHSDFKARLIGNGAIPHSKQLLVPPQRDETNTACAAVFTMNNKALRNDLLDVHELDLAVSTFALLTLDGKEATVEYINEDGSLFLKERLSGGPNEVLEWGDGYGPLQS